ncbi:hypothetical protein GALMADRAFT_209612 [Galerina marginata CBS 339.88]|uniref:Ubinuclein middle domain-containing protein n=1 Tax=Galerina marginata (strain CBS 339.88) TaxID=685588 RepID=A0A067T4Y0_GALM3|nr:hypothetical protein GALMADRAFT_209612 [Galerina marginata CBS 339.88]
MDVEMDARPQSPDLQHSPPTTASATTSRRSSLAVAGGNKSITVHGGPASSSLVPISIPVLVHSPSPTPSNVGSVPPAASSSSTAAPGTAAPPPSSSEAVTTATTSTSTAGAAAKPASSAKPRSTKPPKRSPSPSPPPPPAIPLKTIRLDIRLGGPSNYEVDISRQAKETGQRPPTPPPVVKKVADSSESEDDEDDKAGAKPKSKSKKKRKNGAAEYYDTSDPFIDDSELALDERQFFAQTKQQGFYVSSGEVALMKDKTPKKPKSKKISFAAGLHPSLGTGTTPHLGFASSQKPPPTIEGTRDAPIPVDAAPGPVPSSIANINSHASPHDRLKIDGGVGIAADAEHAGQKRKRQNSAIMEGGKRKKMVDESMFHPDLQVAIKDMKDLISSESWENKGKFPPTLKPPLARLAVLAIRLDEYDDDFFSLMPTLFPYNKFTMTKLIKRTVFTDHLALLTERQDVLLAQLQQMAAEGFAKAEEEWEKSVLAWDKRQEKIRNEAAEGSAGTGSAAPTRHPTEEMDVDGPPLPTQGGGGGADGDSGKDGKDKDGKEHGQHPPAKRYRMTEQMKSIVWELVLLSNECCRLENEKNSLEGSVIQISDQGLRKVLYQKIVSAYPDGWMSSGQISRDVSAMKKKLEREAMEQENDD